MELVKVETMFVTCEHCKAQSKTDNLDDFKEVGHTYPPTILFICPDCKDESRVFGVPSRLLQHMVMKISKERGYDNNWQFARGQSVTA